MKIKVIENGDYVLGKATDIINHLIQRKIELNENCLNEKLCVEELVEKEEEIVKIIQEILEFDYNDWVILKLYRNLENELCYEELNI